MIVDAKHHRHFVAKRGEVLRQIGDEFGGVVVSFPRSGVVSDKVIMSSIFVWNVRMQFCVWRTLQCWVCLLSQQKVYKVVRVKLTHFWLTPNCLCTIRSSSVVEKISGTEADVINKFLNSITTQLWNEALWLDVANHVICVDQSEFIISV